MTEWISANFVAEGTSEGQPVACYDLTPPGHLGTAELAGQLDMVRIDYFKTRGSDSSAIVAVVIEPSTGFADYGLRFVAAAGPLGGCGEATLFATYACTNPDVSPSVTFETSAGLIAGSNLGSGRIAIQMPAVAAASVSRQVEYEDEFLRIRSVTAGGNRFAAVTADDLGVRLDQPLNELTVAGNDLLLWLRRHASTSGVLHAPDMLIITEPVAESSTRSAVIWGDAVLNRGPCGTGTCVRYVLAVEDGEVNPGSHLIHESPFGYSFEACSIAVAADGPTDRLNILLSGLVQMV